MTTRSEKEKQKVQQEKFQAILSNLLKDEDNKYCVDCDAKGPRWASWNLGIFMCIRCAGIHRNLGVHISKVKSVNLDTWTPEQVAMMMEVGNSRARAAYEANLPDNYRRPQTDSALEAFIRAKYETKKYLAKEWVPPKPVVPKELQEDDRDKRKSKLKSSGGVQLNSVPRSQPSAESSVSANAKTAEPKPAQKVQAKVQSPQQPKAPPPASSNTADLIGLDAPASVPVSNSNSLLGDLEDFMGAPMSAPSSQPATQNTNNQVSNGSLSGDLFGVSSGEETKTEKVSTKDSILALYGGQQQQTPQFGVPGGMYMPQQQGMGPGMYNMAPPQQQQQQAQPGMHMQQPMYNNQMGIMGMNQGMQMANSMGMGPNSGMSMAPQQQGMRMNQPNMGAMFQQQPQMQQMQYQQMQQQMANMSLGQPAQMGMNQNGIPAGQGWGGQQSGHTLSTNLWQ